MSTQVLRAFARPFPAITVAVVGAWLPAVASAQTANPSRWTLEIHGSRIVASAGAGRAVALPEPGTPVRTVPDGPFTREVPSWLFGDGTRLFNEIAANLGLTQRITPLDPHLTNRMFRQEDGTSVGVRLARHVTPRIDLEFGVDFIHRRDTTTEAFRAGVEATRASYESAFQAYFGNAAAGPLASAETAAEAAYHDAGYEVLSTAAVNVKLGGVTWQPYVTVGGGIASGFGTSPSIVMDTRQQFVLPDGPFEQRAWLRIGGDSGPRPLALVGGGVTRLLTSRLGVRADARMLISSSAADTRIESGVIVESTGGSFTIYPFDQELALVFSRGSAIRSSLGGRVSQQIFKGDGLRYMGAVSFGLFVRM